MPRVSSGSVFLVVTAFELVLYKTALVDKYLPSKSTDRNTAIILSILIAVNGFIWTLWTVFVYPFCFSPLRHLPKPPNSAFLIGHGPSIFSKPPGKDFLEWTKTVPNDGLIHFHTFFNQDVLLPLGHEALKDVLQTNSYDFEKPPRLRRFLQRVQGDGLSVVEGTQHKFQRKNMNPAFQMRHIKDLYPLFWAKSCALVNALDKDLGCKGFAEVEFNDWASRVSMDIIGVAALGRDVGSLENPENPIMENFKALFDFTPEAVVFFGAHMVLPEKLIACLPIFSTSKKTMKTSTTFLRKCCRDMVDEKQSQVKNEVDILSVVLRSKSFSYENTVDQLITFLAAGHETTANSLTWACYLLATHPNIQEALRDEVRAAIPSFDGEVTAEQLETMPKLHGVVCETLRLFPGAPILLRESVRPTRIQDQFVPIGTTVVLAPWAINRNEEIWGKDAAVFSPERWVDEDSKINNHGGTKSNYAFMTFLQGPRRCIGETFSRSELRCLVAALVGSYKIEMVEPDAPVIPAGIVGLKPKDGLYVRLIPIPGWK